MKRLYLAARARAAPMVTAAGVQSLPPNGAFLTVSLTLTAEDRPADFRAKLGRDTRAMGSRRNFWKRLQRRENTPSPHRGRRLAALAAAIAVPAMAAPGDWRAFNPVDSGDEQAALVMPMPFEQAGNSFPGSAFYYVEEAPQLAYDFDIDTGLLPIGDLAGAPAEAETALAASSMIGPAARGFRSVGGGVDKARALQCLTMAVYYEAASEAVTGQRAVAQVVLNRVAHPSYPGSVCGVVFQGSERRTGCQFSFSCDGSLGRRPSRFSWVRAQGVAQRALRGEVYGSVGLATHYHTTAIYPYWAPSLNFIGTIGAHRFYRWRGLAGQSAAFRSAYRGNEPMAGPHPHSAADDSSPAADNPVALARAYEEARSKAEDAARAQPAPGSAPGRTPSPAYSRAVTQSGGDAQFTAQNLPKSGGVREKYANSGQWLRQPGGQPSGPAPAPPAK